MKTPAHDTFVDGIYRPPFTHENAEAQRGEGASEK